MDIENSIFHHFKLTKAKHKKIADFWVIWPQCAIPQTSMEEDQLQMPMLVATCSNPE